MTRWGNHGFNNLGTCNFFDLSPFITFPFVIYKYVNCEYNNSIHDAQLKVKCHVMTIWKNSFTTYLSYHIVVIDLPHITPMVSMIVMKFIVCFFHCSFTTSGLVSSCTIFMIAHSSMLIIFLFLFLHVFWCYQDFSFLCVSYIETLTLGAFIMSCYLHVFTTSCYLHCKLCIDVLFTSTLCFILTTFVSNLCFAIASKQYDI